MNQNGLRGKLAVSLKVPLIKTFIGILFKIKLSRYLSFGRYLGAI